MITDKLLGCRMPLPAKSQKETFNAIVEESLGLECDYEVVKSIHENLNQMVAENKENPEPLTLDKSDMTHLLENAVLRKNKLRLLRHIMTNPSEKMKHWLPPTYPIQGILRCAPQMLKFPLIRREPT